MLSIRRASSCRGIPTMTPRSTRRGFLRRASLVGMATSLPAWFLEESEPAAAATLAANNKPGIALIGCGGRGRAVAGQAVQHGAMVACCDLDDAHLGEAKKQWPDAAVFKDFRNLLERKDIDVVVNGTPDHWHTLVNMAAVKASKDVYSEKPLTLTIDEGRRLVEVVKITKRVLQTGSQQRSDKKFRLACELVR